MKRNIVLILAFIIVLSITTISSWADFYFEPNLIYMNWPTTSRRITDIFGTPRDGGTRTHTGIDIGAMRRDSNQLPIAGDPIYAAMAGTVKARIDHDYGKVVYVNSQGYNPWLKKNEFVQTRYVHLDSYIANVGQSVQKGQLIATMGGTFGYLVHLHFETRIGTVLNMPTDNSATVPRDPLVSYTFNEPYRLPVTESRNSSHLESDSFGEYGILKNEMLYTIDFILNQDLARLPEYGITKGDLDELLIKLQNSDDTLYKKLLDYLK